MRKIVALALLVVGVWTGYELFQHGPDGAFGGALRDLRGASQGEVSATVARAQKSASDARDRQLSRIEKQLEDGSVGLGQD